MASVSALIDMSNEETPIYDKFVVRESGMV